MGKVTPEILERELKKLEDDGIEKDLIEKIRDKLKDEELEEEQLEYFLNKIYINFNNAIVEAAEPVGTVAAQSIGEPGTQMSIPGSELVIIKYHNTIDVVRIDNFIDGLISNTNDCENIDGSEILNLYNSNYYVPCVGQDERMHWGRLRQVSRHPPGGEILHIHTRSGREIYATCSHSFLIRKENKIIPIEGISLKVGDRIPIMRQFPPSFMLEKINIETYIPENEAWYGSEPVKEDGLGIAFETGKADVLVNGLVYPKAFSNTNIKIPEIIDLTYSFGWILGAYLAVGSNASTFVSITNIEEQYQKQACDFADSFSITWHIKYEDGGFGPSTSVILSSSLFAKLLERMCGKEADNKNIPYWTLNAPDNFVSGLLQAYFDGAGIFSLEGMQIRAGTNSKQIRDVICLLLSRFGIFASKYEEKNQYSLRIPGKYAEKFNEKIGSIIPKKKSILELMAKQEKIKTNTYDSVDMVSGFGDLLNQICMKLNIDVNSSFAADIRKYTKSQQIGRQTLQRYMNKFIEKARKSDIDIQNELKILKRIIDSDILWDQIISIKLIKSPTPYVYDFSVEKHENFTTSEGIITHNTLRTFHYAGVEEFSVTQGLPRLIEIVDARRFPSTPQMEVYLEEGYRESEETAIEVHNRIEQIRIEQITHDVDLDFVNWNIVINLIPEICEKKGIDINEIPEILKRYKKKGTIKREGNSIIIDPGIEDLQSLQKMREKILKKVVKGIRGIKRGLLSPSDDNKEWIIKTEGTNLAGVVNIDGVDITRTVSNHIHEVEKLYGIEAARNMIIRESQKVLEQQGLDVDLRHLLILADLMCNTGTIQSIGRHGISGSKSSVFARAAFEVTVNQLLDAGLYGEEERLLGIPENVIIGQVIPIGTGRCFVMFDLDENLKILKRKK